MYLAYNVLGLISLKGADLLFGQEPILPAATRQQEALSRLVERSSLHRLFYGCAVDASYEAECFLEAAAHGGEVYLRQVPADEISARRPVARRAVLSYVHCPVRNAGTDGARSSCCWKSLTCRGGSSGGVTNWTTRAGGEKSAWTSGRPVVLRPRPPVLRNNRKATSHRRYEDEGRGQKTLRAVTHTGVRNTITWVPNLLVRGQPVSDYDGAIDLQDALNAKNSQVGRVLLKHSDPHMVFPEEAFDKGNIRSDHEVFAFSDPHKLPQYITWNAELTRAMADRDFVLNQLLVRTKKARCCSAWSRGPPPTPTRRCGWRASTA